MTAYEDEEQSKRLTDEQKISFQKIADHLNKLADKLGEPIDPKVDAMLRMAADCIDEQIQMEKYYPRECSHCDEHNHDEEHEGGGVITAREPDSTPYLFLDNDDEDEDNNESMPKLMIPSADQLKSWLSNGAPKEDDNDDPQPG